LAVRANCFKCRGSLPKKPLDSRKQTQPTIKISADLPDYAE
jgi:hypothetical protein